MSENTRLIGLDTISDIVEFAYRLIGMKGITGNLTEEDKKVAYQALILLMDHLENAKFTFRKTYGNIIEKEFITDQSSRPVLIYGLAYFLAGIHAIEPPVFIANMFTESKKELKNSQVKMFDMVYPSTIPMGSGNQYSGGSTGRTFFPGANDNGLQANSFVLTTEAGERIVLGNHG